MKWQQYIDSRCPYANNEYIQTMYGWTIKTEYMGQLDFIDLTMFQGEIEEEDMRYASSHVEEHKRFIDTVIKLHESGGIEEYIKLYPWRKTPILNLLSKLK